MYGWMCNWSVFSKIVLYTHIYTQLHKVVHNWQVGHDNVLGCMAIYVHYSSVVGMYDHIFRY